MDASILQARLYEAGDLLEDGKAGRSLVAFRKVVRQWPKLGEAWVGYGCAAYRIGELEKAERAWLIAKQVQPDSVNILLRLGHNYESIRQPKKAMACFEEAAAVDPKSVNPLICIALLHEKCQQFEKAHKAVDQCLTINEADDQARYVFALLCHRQNFLDLAEHKLRDLISSNPKHEFVRYAARYELAQVLDRTGRYDEAMQSLLEAKRIVQGLVDQNILYKQYHLVAENRRRYARSHPKNILRVWAKSFPESKRNSIPRFCFLGGHPRSGTTLLERVIGSHPEVGAVDEPTITGIAATAIARQSFGSPVTLLNLARQRYIAALCQLLGEDADGKLLLEKNPSPTTMLPILLRVFPELRIIIALRDPRDVVLSCYFQNLPLNFVNCNFLSFERLGVHYADLMDVWLTVKEWEGVTWIETKYEDTVADLEKEGRRVTQFLGLQWHENQGRYFRDSLKDRIYSPTYYDVSQPVYARSVGRWQNYEKYLEPILPVLEPYCRMLGYS